MKLRNLIFALFLAIGAIGFTACTGDDGDAGPAGPAGPAGEQGEQGEPGDSGDATNFYDFLKSWGSETGEIGCDDSILRGSGPFPGPAALAPITNPNATIDSPINVQCLDGGVLESITSTLTDGPIAVGGQNIAAAGEIILVKTMRGEEEKSTVDTPASEFNRAMRTITTKNFVGGMVFADLDMTGTFDGPDERRLLYSDCGVGTAPSDVKGSWRGIRIVESSQIFVNGVGATNDDGTPSLSSVTTVKACVKLDSHPGVTKCYINVAGGTNPGAQVALYHEDGSLTPVKDAMKLGTLDTSAGTLFAANDLPGVDEICEIFDEGAPDGS